MNWVDSALQRVVARRALKYALAVGALLIGINHGDAILRGDVSPGRLLRMALTMLVPYAVSTLTSLEALAEARLNSGPAADNKHGGKAS